MSRFGPWDPWSPGAHELEEAMRTVGFPAVPGLGCFFRICKGSKVFLGTWGLGAGCRIASSGCVAPPSRKTWEFPIIRGTLFWAPYNKDPAI